MSPVHISNEMMTLIGLLVTVIVVMGGALLAIGRYQRQVDQNTDDIASEREDRKAADEDVREQLKEDRVSSYKRDSDLQKEIRRSEEECRKEFERFDRRVAEVERRTSDVERHTKAKIIQLPKKKDG